MATWYMTVDLTDEYEKFRVGATGFFETRDNVVKRLVESDWAVAYSLDGSQVNAAIERLSKTQNLAEYEAAMRAVYDLADEDRVWIETP